MDINCRYHRLLISFYIVCGLCLVTAGFGTYFIKNLKNKLSTTNVALETVAYEFKVCKHLYKKSLTYPNR